MAEPGTRLVIVFGPLLALAVLVLALRWTFGTGSKHGIPHAPDPNDPTGDGLLEEVARVPTVAAAEVLRDRLARARIRATVSRADDGYRLLVFADDHIPAKLVIREPDG